MLIIGSHVSFGGFQLLAAAKEAINYNSDTFMFYTGAPTNTVRKEIDDDLTKEALKQMQDNNIDINNVICHAPYIINPATPDDAKKDFAISFLKQELSRCQKLNVKYLVLHPGSAVGIDKSVGLNNIVEVLNQALDNDYDVMILLETMAGKGSECGTSTDEIKYLVNNCKFKSKLGVCLDTCHLNDSGVDLTKFDDYLDEFDKKVGIDKIKCVHINDSKNEINAHKDRHDNIGFGTIGFDTLLSIIYNPRLDNIPKILETPYIGETREDKKRIYPPYKFEIDMIKNKKFNDNILNDIITYYKK